MAPDENVVNSTKLSSSFISFLLTVPILIFPLAVADDSIEVIVVNFVDPIAVLDEATPVISSNITAPLELVPVTVNLFPVSV